MRNSFLGTAALVCGLLMSAPAFAQPGGPGGPCTRADLEKAVEGYIQAQKTSDASTIPFGGEWITYNENMDLSSLGSGMLSKPQKIDFYRTLAIDVPGCAAYVEVVITDPAHPYVLGTLLSGRGGKISNVDVLVTDAGDWLFNAKNTMDYSKAENWSTIAEADRDTRATLIAAADAYLNSFDDKKIVVPWGKPCARLEGGAYTAKGGPGVVSPDDSCDVGVPSGVKLINRRYIVDESLGSVAVLLNFGKNERPDSHTFRIEKGKIRYVHTITVCAEANCGFPPPGANPVLPSQSGAKPAATPAAAAPAKK